MKRGQESCRENELKIKGEKGQKNKGDVIFEEHYDEIDQVRERTGHSSYKLSSLSHSTLQIWPCLSELGVRTYLRNNQKDTHPDMK